MSDEKKGGETAAFNTKETLDDDVSYDSERQAEKSLDNDLEYDDDDEVRSLNSVPIRKLLAVSNNNNGLGGIEQQGSTNGNGHGHADKKYNLDNGDDDDLEQAAEVVPSLGTFTGSSSSDPTLILTDRSDLRTVKGPLSNRLNGHHNKSPLMAQDPPPSSSQMTSSSNPVKARLTIDEYGPTNDTQPFIGASESKSAMTVIFEHTKSPPVVRRTPSVPSDHSVGSGNKRFGSSSEIEAGFDNFESTSSRHSAGSAGRGGSLKRRQLSTKIHRQGAKVLVPIDVMNAAYVAELESASTSNWSQTAIIQKKNEYFDNVTTAPVNEYGFPKGQGNTEDEKRGPYMFVIATVQTTHFGENEVYYYIVREDTNIRQRASASDFLLIPHGSKGEEAAIQAALYRNRADGGRNKCCQLIWKKVKTTCSIITWFMKEQAFLILEGKDPYSCKIKLTSAAFFIFCSAVILIIDFAKYSFLPISWDRGLSIIALILWIFLVLELLFALFIRPADYSSMMVSEKAYAPRTARYINNFHLLFELLALALFAVDFSSLHERTTGSSNDFAPLKSAIFISYGPSGSKFFKGHLFYMLARLRILSLVRHWKNSWIDNKFSTIELDNASHAGSQLERLVGEKKSSSAELPRAANIGTSLMMINSHRAMVLLVLVAGIIPMLTSVIHGSPDTSLYDSADLLHQFNIAAGTETDGCEFLQAAVGGWLQNSIYNTRLVRAEIYPNRCDFQEENGIVTYCDDTNDADFQTQFNCKIWDKISGIDSISGMAWRLKVRSGALLVVHDSSGEYETRVTYDVTHCVKNANLNAFLLQAALLFAILFVLNLLCKDASRLVILPLRRMLKIVLLYAQDPLAPNPLIKANNQEGNEDNDEQSANDLQADIQKHKLGSYETQRLITAITKITDLLRKCWGVAGAGIISANLKRNLNEENIVFNPTVPGKLVWALFAFAGINDFSKLLQDLNTEVMRLINDVAKVVHNEAYRWGHRDSGQCNKNNGSTFLMVYRIGDFEEVKKKKELAADVIFMSVGEKKKSTSANKRSLRQKEVSLEKEANSIELASLPGITGFTDKALLGMLKSFAGIQREKSLKEWRDDFRLGMGVGAFSVEMNFGMDAGWAVEGAVGSNYKIDATYLSPFVNMASRMMSACNQYGISILVTHAFQKLLSPQAQEKLRHVDTVYVKGSSKKNQIYTYDARHRGVNFFLHSRTDEIADKEAHNYTAEIWRRDQDLISMRDHLTPEFIEIFEKGFDEYITGNWEEAVKLLKEADHIMVRTAVEENRCEAGVYEKQLLLDQSNQTENIRRLRNEFGDGVCQALVSFMEKENCIAPSDWDGVRQLVNK